MTDFIRSYALIVLACLGIGCAGGVASSVSAPEVPTIRIYTHEAWDETPPKGVEADGIRRNLAPGDSVTFKDMTLTVNDMQPADSEMVPDVVNLTLASGTDMETRTVNEDAAFNWNGYHIAIVGVYTQQGELGFGSSAIEIATVESLPDEVAQSTTANGAEHRLRVPHTIDKLTLHHSATPHSAEDDLGQKLRNMQAWGERDRDWFDIPYHFIIDSDGSVFEARDYHYVGDTNTRYNPTGHFLINCYGNYSAAEPNEAQLESIANLMAWATAEYDIEPLVIYGHKDLAQTACPGDNLYRYIEDGTLARMVKDVLAKGQPELVWVEEIGSRGGAE